MFTRRLSNIRKRYISWYAILNINNAEFNAIEVDIKNVENKINDKVTISYFIVKSKDEKLGIETKGETLEEALVRLQECVEEIYYEKVYDKRRQHLVAKYERTADIKMEETT